MVGRSMGEGRFRGDFIQGSGGASGCDWCYRSPLSSGRHPVAARHTVPEKTLTLGGK